jgi:hypothetical protein
LFGDRTGVGVPSKRINDLSSGVDIHDEVSFVLALAHKRFDRAANFIPSRSNRPGIYLTPPRPLRRRFENLALGAQKPLWPGRAAAFPTFALSPSSKRPFATSRAHGPLKSSRE